MKEFLTHNQHEIIRGCIHARDNSTQVGFISPSGIGMKYAIGKLLADYPHERIIFADVQHSENVDEICLAIITVCSTVRFSNLDCRNASLFDLVRILKDRMKKDVKGKPLIVLDNVWALRNPQMKYLNRFLTLYGNTCGIVLRITERALKRFSKQNPEVFEEFYNNSVSQWIVLEENAKKQIAQLADAYGVKDKVFIEDLSARTTNFTQAKKYIDKYLNANESDGHNRPNWKI